MKAIWLLIRPYVTVQRVTLFVVGILGPPLVLLGGKLAVLLADLGYNLTPAQITAAFVAGVVAVLAVLVPLVVKFMDSRTQVEAALIHMNRPDLIGAKSIKHQIEQGSTNRKVPPQPDHVPVLDDPDGDGLDEEASLSQPDDIAESNSDPASADERRARESLPERE